MKYIVVDLEMNAIDKINKKERLICATEVIEIGAVMLDEEYRELSSFKALVKPQYSPQIWKKFEELTGITTSMVASAPFFEKAFNDFAEWCFNGGKSEEVTEDKDKEEFIVYAWSVSDHQQLSREIKLKKIDVTEKMEQVLSSFEDFQYKFTKALKIEKALSLEQAVDYAGLDFEGRKHDALCDARNTAELLKMVKNGEVCSDALKKVKAAVEGEQIATCLGDKFDFAKLLEGMKK